MGTNKGIWSYSIHVDDDDLKKLRENIWSETPVKGIFEYAHRQYDIGFVYRGSHIRKMAKKSYRIQFPTTVSGIRELHLNAEYKDKSLIRNKLSLDFFSSIGVLSPISNHVLLTLNNEFQGIYLQLESVDKYFLRRRNLSAGSIYYAENDNANFSLMSPITEKVKKRFESGYSRKLGSSTDDKALGNLVYQINTLSSDEFESKISNYIDIDRYLRWLTGVVCTQNYDGFIHNYALYQRKDTGLFEMIPWDYDATWGRDIHGKEMAYNYIPIEGFNTLTARFLDIPRFRKQYHSIMQNVLEDQFTTGYLEKKIMSMYDQLRPHVKKDPFLKQSIEQFHTEPEIILSYIKDRNNYLKNRLYKLK